MLQQTLGGEHCTTRSTSGISNPRAATLVATRTSNAPFLKPFSVNSLCFWGMSPWRDWALWNGWKIHTEVDYSFGQLCCYRVSFCRISVARFTVFQSVPVWVMYSWKARWPLSWSHRRRSFCRGCRCTPGSRLLALPHAETSGMLLPVAIEGRT